MRILSILVLLLALTMFFACSDDGSNPFGDPPIDDSDRPTIPEPTSYNGSVPTVSERLIVELVLLSNFSAAVDSAIPWGCGPPYMDYPCTMFPINTDSARIPLVLDDTIVTDLNSLQTKIDYRLDGSWGSGYVQPLESPRPYLQLVRYWVRLGPPERYSGNTSKTTTRTTTRGITNTNASEFTKSLGIETSVGGSWFIDFSVTVKTEFSWTQSQEISITEEETLEESFTITCPENKNLVYCVWQLIDEYSIVDSTGTEIFTAVKFVFDEEVLMSSIPTEDLVPMTTYFDN